MNGLKLLCPVRKAKININSEQLDDIGQFTKFILWAIGNGYTVDEIDKVIELGEYVIREEVMYLCNIGFAIENDGKYFLSEGGNDYLNLMDTVENVNSKEIDVQINCFSGEVKKFNYQNYPYESAITETQKLPSLVSRQFLYNKNYANSKEFLFENYPELFESISESRLDSIYVELKSDNEINYIIYELSEVPSANADFLNEALGVPSLLLERTTQKYSYRIVDERLSNYRNVLPTLSLLKKFDYGLLSSKSLKIILLEDQEIEKNKNISPICIDTFNGEIIPSATNNFVKQSKPKVHLPVCEFDLSEEDVRNALGIDDINWALTEPSIESVKTLQLVPFSIFIEEE